MKLYLFGGAETDQGQAPQLISMLNQVVQTLRPKQLLHIPFARTDVPPGEESVWGEGWVQKGFDLEGIELLDARREDDLRRANQPVIFINGGNQGELLYQKVMGNQRLYELVMKAQYLIGESAGSKITAEYQRITAADGTTAIRPGLGILPKTIIEPHYTERNRHQLLRDELYSTVGAQYGVGIDSLTAMVIDTDTYPESYGKMGEGLVEFLQK